MVNHLETAHWFTISLLPNLVLRNIDRHRDHKHEFEDDDENNNSSPPAMLQNYSPCSSPKQTIQKHLPKTATAAPLSSQNPTDTGKSNRSTSGASLEGLSVRIAATATTEVLEAGAAGDPSSSLSGDSNQVPKSPRKRDRHRSRSKSKAPKNGNGFLNLDAGTNESLANAFKACSFAGFPNALKDQSKEDKRQKRNQQLRHADSNESLQSQQSQQSQHELPVAQQLPTPPHVQHFKRSSIAESEDSSRDGGETKDKNVRITFNGRAVQVQQVDKGVQDMIDTSLEGPNSSVLSNQGSKSPEKVISPSKPRKTSLTRIANWTKRLVWIFQIDGERHTISFSHGVLTGRKKVLVDDVKIFKTQWTLMESKSNIEFAIDGIMIILTISLYKGGFKYKLAIKGMEGKAMFVNYS
jgi:hypothetical protein